MVEPVVLDASDQHASALAFSPGSAALITGGMGGDLKQWDIESAKLLAEWEGHDRSINTISYMPDGERVLTGGSDGRVHLRNAKDGAVERTFERYVSGIASPDGTVFALTKDRGERIYVHDVAEDTVTATLSTSLKKLGWPAFIADGRLAAAGFGEQVELWDVGKTERAATLGGHDTSVIGMASTGPHELATTDWKGTLRVWGLEDGTVITTVRAGTGGYAFLASHPSRDLLAVGGDHRIGICTKEGDELSEIEMPVKGVYALAFSPDGRWLANAAADGKVRLWAVDELA